MRSLALVGTKPCRICGDIGGQVIGLGGKRYCCNCKTPAGGDFEYCKYIYGWSLLKQAYELDDLDDPSESPDY